jgi:hypothetical protein
MAGAPISTFTISNAFRRGHVKNKSRRFGVVDAKLDAKPGTGAMYQVVARLPFGIGAVITVVLKAVGLAFH